MGRSGVFRISPDWDELQVQVRTVDATGTAARPPACVPAWTSASPQVLTVLRSTDRGGFVKPRVSGITELTVSYPCQPALSRTVAVVVGSGAIDKPFAASGTAALYYPAKLEVTPPGNYYVSSGRVYVRPIDRGVQFVASVFNGLEGRITPSEFPMKWSVANAGVLTIAKQYDHTVFLDAVGNGTTAVTFTVEGLSQSFEVTVDNRIAPSGEPAASLAVRSLVVPAVRTVSSTIGLPITVKPATNPVALPITVRPVTYPVKAPVDPTNAEGTRPGGLAGPGPIAKAFQVSTLVLTGASATNARAFTTQPLVLVGAASANAKAFRVSALVLTGASATRARTFVTQPFILVGSSAQSKRSFIVSRFVIQSQ